MDIVAACTSGRERCTRARRGSGEREEGNQRSERLTFASSAPFASARLFVPPLRKLQPFDQGGTPYERDDERKALSGEARRGKRDGEAGSMPYNRSDWRAQASQLRWESRSLSRTWMRSGLAGGADTAKKKRGTRRREGRAGKPYPLFGARRCPGTRKSRPSRRSGDLAMKREAQSSPTARKRKAEGR